MIGFAAKLAFLRPHKTSVY